MLIAFAALLVLGGSHACEPPLAKAQVRCGVPKLVLDGAAIPSRPSEAIRGEFPWHAALYHENGGSFRYCCGGSLISERFVLTAGHCAVNQNNGYQLATRRVKVRLGGHELNGGEGCVQEVGVRKIHVHEGFSENDRKHDLALIELSEAVVYTRWVLPICVDLSDSEDSNFYRQHGKVPGWGYTELDAVSDWLRMTELPIVNYTTCLASNPGVFAETISEGMFCAGYANGTSVCNGDSGGGLVTFRRDHWVLRGVVSFTSLREGELTLCDSEDYAGFTKVRFYRKWLKKILSEEEQVDTPQDSGEDEQLGPCGERKINKRSLIVNGVRSYAGEWPWHVAIYEIEGRSKRYICGGTLISDQFVMTAAHCLVDENRQQRTGTIVVQLGQDDLFESSVHMREVRVSKITPHEAFDPVAKSNDIALLELSSTVLFNNYIQPACLPKKDDSLNLLGALGAIIGWGYQQPWSFMISNTLQSVRVPVVNTSNCATGKDFGAELDGVLCIGSANGSNACTGDSGGGIMFEKDGVWTVGGVISALDTVNGFCNPDGFLKAANTEHFVKWVKKVVKSTLKSIFGGKDRVMSFLKTGTDYPTTARNDVSGTPTPYPDGSSHVHHHHHHYYYDPVTQRTRGHPHHRHRHHHDCKQKDDSRSSSSESNESGDRTGLKAPIKKLLKTKKCLIKDLKDTLLSKLF
ncbi:coagulation factor X [Culex quinquefasciatus]|uniref:Coagulation factor X n=1 Tax=Culex quinquefasciatus TaxID=7176 RepID=B0X6U9_CULQU|nr:coagulation factor X [Culex quinquefasciatus]|eukprot:XP_001865371.1 coagulation factor X [Culex quinquefasciatus]